MSACQPQPARGLDEDVEPLVRITDRKCECGHGISTDMRSGCWCANRDCQWFNIVVPFYDPEP